MILARVVGTVVSTKKESSMDGLRFMLVQPIDVDDKPIGPQAVAVDAVGAGVGECVELSELGVLVRRARLAAYNSWGAA